VSRLCGDKFVLPSNVFRTSCRLLLVPLRAKHVLAIVKLKHVFPVVVTYDLRCQKCEEDVTKNNDTSLIRAASFMRTLQLTARSTVLCVPTTFSVWRSSNVGSLFSQQLLLVVTSELCELCDAGEDIHHS